MLAKNNNKNDDTSIFLRCPNLSFHVPLVHPKSRSQLISQQPRNYFLLKQGRPHRMLQAREHHNNKMLRRTRRRDRNPLRWIRTPNWHIHLCKYQLDRRRLKWAISISFSFLVLLLCFNCDSVNEYDWLWSFQFGGELSLKNTLGL